MQNVDIKEKTLDHFLKNKIVEVIKRQVKFELSQIDIRYACAQMHIKMYLYQDI